MAMSRSPFSPLTKLRMPVFMLVLIAMATLILMPSVALADSTVHGRTYDWSTFKVLSPAIVTVNTTPEQKIVSSDGNYSFVLPKGSYQIKAEARTGPGLLYSTENITVPDTGDFTIDLLLFPGTDLSTLETLNESLPVSAPDSPPQGQPQALMIEVAALAAAILLTLAAAGVYLIYQRRKARALETVQSEEAVAMEQVSKSPPPPTQAAKERVLRQDCIDVIKAIEKNGGRMTQLDLRKAVPYSEVRISLIVSDLEDAGLLRKVKKGRGNVLILTDAGNEPGKPEASTGEKND